MIRVRVFALFSAFILAPAAAIGATWPPPGIAAGPYNPAAATVARVSVPLGFVENGGQMQPDVSFALTGAAGTALFQDSRVVVRTSAAASGNLSAAADSQTRLLARRFEREMNPGWKAGSGELRIDFENASNVTPEALDRLPGQVNYISSRLRTSAGRYSGLVYRQLWPGIDAVYRAGKSGLKSEYIVEPGSDPSRIALRYSGCDSLWVTDDGRLSVDVGGRVISEERPYVYQDEGGKRRKIDAAYCVDGDLVTFRLGSYDDKLPLVIDPSSDMTWGTMLGGSTGFESIEDIYADETGVYVVGETFSTDFPYNHGQKLGGEDVLVAKLSADGSALLFATLISGSEDEAGWSITVDPSKNIYVCGHTFSHDYPATPGAYDTTFNRFTEAWLSKLSPDGATLLYSTYLGGVYGDDWGRGVEIDSTGIYVAGQTSSSDFPTTAGAYDTSFGGVYDVFVTKFNLQGDQLLYSTVIGADDAEWAEDMTIDADGCAYVTGLTQSSLFPALVGSYDRSFNGGTDVFITKLNADASALVFSTFLGSTQNEVAYSIDLDPSKNVYVTGYTKSTRFPTTASAFDRTFNGTSDNAYVTKLAAAGNALSYSTFIGGANGLNRGDAISVDSGGHAYIVGATLADDYPVTANAYDTTISALAADATLTKLSANGSALDYSTFLGGSNAEAGTAVYANDAGFAFAGGYTYSSDFPTTPGVYDQFYHGNGDAFLVKIATNASSDTTAPAAPVVNDNKQFMTVGDQMSASWTASDPESGIAQYMYAIGTSPADPGSGYLVGWKSTGTVNSATESAAPVVGGSTVYWYVKARNGAGLWSPVGASDGVFVASHSYRTPGEAKLQPDGVAVAIPLAAVTATSDEMSGRVYIEDPDRSSGIGVESAAAIARGDRVGVAGVLGTIGGQRVITSSKLQKTASGDVLIPLTIVCRSRATSGFFYVQGTGAGQAGTSSLPLGMSLSHTGMLVRVTGSVAAVDAETITLMDGSSADGIKVLKSKAPAGVGLFDYVAVTGISSLLETGGGGLEMLLAPRDSSDFQILAEAI